MKNWTLKTKIMGVIGLLVALLALVGGLSTWSMNRLKETADFALLRSQQAMDTHDILVNSLRAYQNQADTIINDNADGKDFVANAAKLNTAIKQFERYADTAEEKNWAVEMSKTEKSMVDVYQEQILPLIRTILVTKDPAEMAKLETKAKEADARTDLILKQLADNAEKCTASLIKESDNAKKDYERLGKQMRAFILSLSIVAAVVGGYWGSW